MADYWSFSTNVQFKDKVKHEMQAAAIAIMNELATTPNHAERVTYASKILSGEASVSEMCIGVITNTTIKTYITADTDYTSDLAFVVASLYNAFAGISTE